MTSPNYNNPNQVPDAVNAGDGISGAAATSPADSLQHSMNTIGGPLGAVAGWMLSGLAPKLIGDAEQSTSASPTGAYENAAEKAFTHITGVGSQVMSPISMLMQAVQGVLGGGFGDMSFLSNLFSLRWAQVDDIQDGQLALNDQVELLSPLQDYGSAYALGVGGFLPIGEGKQVYDKQVGPMTGCSLASGGIVLHDYGLWDIRARMSFSFINVLTGRLTWEVRVVRDDNGATFSRQIDTVSDNNSTTREIVTTVVVPNDGRRYRVEVWVTSIAPIREIFGGPEQNRLTAQHITRSTSNPI